MRQRERIHQIKYLLIPLLGVLFWLWYVKSAGADVVYSDYIRLIYDYLPDVTNPAKFFVPDVLTRIPAAFLARIINVQRFGYSVTFDRILTVAGMGLIALMLGMYMYRQHISLLWQIPVGIVLFSLNKWEILLNGTAWAHVVSFGLFYVNYYLLDLLWTGEADVKQELMLCLMPFLWLLFAGEYIASYAVTMILICLLGMLSGGADNWKSRRSKSMFRGILMMTAAALGLYLLSRHFAVWEHAGSTEMSLTEVIKTSPLFIPRFFVKSFAGTVIGQETAASFIGGHALPDIAVLLIGALVLAAYAFAFVLYFGGDMMDRTVFPLVLLISGFINHLLVTAGRWIFLREDYALSSRYGGQFMIGITGILLVFSMYQSTRKRGERKAVMKRRTRIMAAAALVTVFIAAGNCYTTYQEIRKAPYREQNYERMAEAVLHYDTYPEEELLKIMEWHKDPAILYESLRILKDNELNVFRAPAVTAEPAKAEAQ